MKFLGNFLQISSHDHGELNKKATYFHKSIYECFQLDDKINIVKRITQEETVYKLSNNYQPVYMFKK